MPKPGWGAVVQGDPADLDDWAYALKQKFDPWVEMHGNLTVLRSASFDELTSADQVRDRAVASIARLNGALALSEQTRPVRFDGVIQFAPDGQLHRSAFAEIVGVEARGKARAVADAVVIGPDGTVVPPPPPQPSEVQRWAAMAENDDVLDDALIYFGMATDWFDIYKALECLILKFGGGKESAFFALGWASETEILRLKRTANLARHAKGRFDPLDNPMPLQDARELLGQLLRRALRAHP
jgi:hypothetical protein